MANTERLTSGGTGERGLAAPSFAVLLDEIQAANGLHNGADPAKLADQTNALTTEEDAAGVVRVHPRALAAAVRTALSSEDRAALHKALAPDWPLGLYTPSALGAAQVIERVTAGWQTEPVFAEPFLVVFRAVAAENSQVDVWLSTLLGVVVAERAKAQRNERNAPQEASGNQRYTEWRAELLRTALALGVIESSPSRWTVGDAEVVAWTAAVDEVSQALTRTLGGSADDPNLLEPARRMKIALIEHRAIVEQQREQWPRYRGHVIMRASMGAALVGLLVAFWFLIGQERPVVFAVAALGIGVMYLAAPSLPFETVPRRVYGDRPRLSAPLSGRRVVSRNVDINGEIHRFLTALDGEEPAGAPSSRETLAVATTVASVPVSEDSQAEKVPSARPRDLREARQRATRAAAVRDGLQALNDQWLAYLLNKTEIFELPRLRDKDYPPTSRYRHALADLADSVDDLWNQPTEEQVAHAERALTAADEAWRDARIAAAEAGQSSLPDREQRALRRAAHHLAVLEDPNLPKAARAERLAQLRHELDKLDTVPLSFDRVLQIPALEHVTRRELN